MRVLFTHLDLDGRDRDINVLTPGTTCEYDNLIIVDGSYEDTVRIRAHTVYKSQVMM